MTPSLHLFFFFLTHYQRNHSRRKKLRCIHRGRKLGKKGGPCLKVPKKSTAKFGGGGPHRVQQLFQLLLLRAMQGARAVWRISPHTVPARLTLCC